MPMPTGDDNQGCELAQGCEDFPVQEEACQDQKNKMEMPEDLLTDFVGHVKNWFKTDCLNLFDNKFRINVWTVQHYPDRLVPEYKIAHSYFVSLNDGQIVDETIHKTFEEEEDAHAVY